MEKTFYDKLPKSIKFKNKNGNTITLKKKYYVMPKTELEKLQDYQKKYFKRAIT
jgi:hypothetical protein